MAIDGGNFGAEPKPPSAASKLALNASSAWSRIAGESPPAASPPWIWSRRVELDIAVVSCSAWSNTSVRLVRQTSSTASMIRRNPGMPWRSAFGK